MNKNVNEINKRIIKKIMIVNFDDINGYSLKNIYPNFHNLNYFFSFKCLKNYNITRLVYLNKVKKKRKKNKCKKYFSSSFSYDIYEKKKEKVSNKINDNIYDFCNKQNLISDCELLYNENNLNIDFNFSNSKNSSKTDNLKNSSIITSSFNSNNPKVSSDSNKIYTKKSYKIFPFYKKKLTNNYLDNSLKKFGNKNASEKIFEKKENEFAKQSSNTFIDLKKSTKYKKEIIYCSSNLSEDKCSMPKNSLCFSEKSKCETFNKGYADLLSGENTRSNGNKFIKMDEYSKYEMKIIMMYSIPYIKKKKLIKFNDKNTKELKNESIIITTELLNIEFFKKVIKFFSTAYFDIGFNILINFYESMKKCSSTKEILEIKLNYKNHNFYENIEIKSINSNYNHNIYSKNKKYQENIFEIKSLNNEKKDKYINIIRTNTKLNIENYYDHNFNSFKNTNIYKNLFYFKEYLLIFFEMILLGYPICVLSKNIQS
ncbi:hypothetical protein PRELSG_1131600 [Plasmodium relictum]|uniref:Uncharacterized protein n=1 Tax=Plasmodium relictum TaxID=85471 RepID=A0A1J1H7M9_PLARL|nr:hypothetical protein PRELSG_1131600 [Plasmodium relictum]CRH00968.1 hypothetical protein PRELSG_1131600 [Plasmodium relictum]